MAMGSSLKSFGSLKGDKKFMEIPRSKAHNTEATSWEKSLIEGVDESHIINVQTPESMTLSFNNHPGGNVSGGNSVTNLLGRDELTFSRIWQGLDNIMDRGIGLGNSMNIEARAEVAEALYNWKKEDSGGWLADAASLTQKLIEMGGNANNPVYADNINRLFMSSLLEGLRRPQMETGISSYLFHDEVFNKDTGERVKLNSPIF